MDPIITGIITGVIVNCLAGLAKYLGGVKEKKTDDKRTELQALIKKATEEIADAIEWEPPPRVEEVCLFIISPEVESIVRQILSSKLMGNGSRNNLKSIESEFLTSFALYVGQSKEQIKSASTILFQSLLEGCERELDDAINKGILSAHEAKSTIRFRIIQDEVETIRRNISFLSMQEKLDVKAVHDFEKKYLQQVGDRHQYIIPPHFDVARKVPIDDLYVMPYFIKRPIKQSEEHVRISGKEFLDSAYRSIVLGDPGSGKSCFANKLCYDLSINRSDRCFCGRNVTPILVILRDYGAEKKANTISILKYIEGVASSRYQLPALTGAFEYLLLNGHTLVIFDGLDELLDTSYRQEISSDIESFCKLYPSVPVLVTSRSVGYEQAPLDERRFEVFHIAEFDDNQIEEYATKWFAIEPEFTPEQREQKVKAFLDESMVVPDLRSNPLMLALMCNIYRGENYIPKNRPDVYEKCAMMLFERWDLSRGIHVQLPFEADIKPAMMYLAHWIYSNDRLHGGVTENQLVNEVGKYLLGRRFEDPDKAKSAAREFIEFCRGRAWVFTDTGTTKEGERLYQFTHRTFLEYFTASHLFRTNPTATKLEEVLVTRILKREWDTVARLSFQILNKTIDGAGDEALMLLLKQSASEKTESESRWKLLSFIARCLEFIVPSPKVTRDIVSACTRESLALYANVVKNKKTKRGRRTIDTDEIIGALINAAVENITIVEDELRKIIIEIAKNDDKSKSIAAIEIGLLLPAYRIKDLKIYQEFSDKIYENCVDIINKMRKEIYTICMASLIRDDTTVTEIVEWYGIDRIFMRGAFSTHGGRFFVPLVDMLTGHLLHLINKGIRTARYEKRIAEIGGILIKKEPPYVEEKGVNFGYAEFYLEEIETKEKEDDTKEKEEVTIDASVLFGGFILLAIVLESYPVKRSEVIVDKIIRVEKGLFGRLKNIFRYRFGYGNVDFLREEIRACGFGDDEEKMVWRWSQGEIDFVKK